MTTSFQTAVHPSARRATHIPGASSGVDESLARHSAVRKVDVILVTRTNSQLDPSADELDAEHGTQGPVNVQDLTSSQAALLVEIEVNRLGLTMLKRTQTRYC